MNACLPFIEEWSQEQPEAIPVKPRTPLIDCVDALTQSQIDYMEAIGGELGVPGAKTRIIFDGLTPVIRLGAAVRQTLYLLQAEAETLVAVDLRSVMEGDGYFPLRQLMSLKLAADLSTVLAVGIQYGEGQETATFPLEDKEAWANANFGTLSTGVENPSFIMQMLWHQLDDMHNLLEVRKEHRQRNSQSLHQR